MAKIEAPAEVRELVWSAPRRLICGVLSDQEGNQYNHNAVLLISH
jgi:hypothetical protein